MKSFRTHRHHITGVTIYITLSHRLTRKRIGGSAYGRIGVWEDCFSTPLK
jgi:hypothetical protein